jgi:hypothetical protein
VSVSPDVMPLSLSLARSLWNDSSRKDLIDNRNYIGDGFYRDCKCTTICHDTFDLLAFDLRPSNFFDTCRVRRSLLAVRFSADFHSVICGNHPVLYVHILKYSAL